AAGANPFFKSFTGGFKTRHEVRAETIATAIRIGNPVNYAKAVKVIQTLDGVVTAVDDMAIMAAKSQLDRVGIGCEPASACSLAGARTLREAAVIKADETCVGILTGHMLKDPEAILNKDIRVPEIEPTLTAVSNAIRI